MSFALEEDGTLTRLWWDSAYTTYVSSSELGGRWSTPPVLATAEIDYEVPWLYMAGDVVLEFWYRWWGDGATDRYTYEASTRSGGEWSPYEQLTPQLPDYPSKSVARNTFAREGGSEIGVTEYVDGAWRPSLRFSSGSAYVDSVMVDANRVGQRVLSWVSGGQVGVRGAPAGPNRGMERN